MLVAIQLAQKEIMQSEELDNKLAQRHCCPGPQWQRCSIAGKQVRSWIVLQPEVTIPTQQLSPTLSAYGVIDYVFGVLPAEHGVFFFSCFRIHLTQALYLKFSGLWLCHPVCISISSETA